MKNRLHALDGLRGLAAFSVFINHLNIAINFSTITTFPLLQVLFKVLNVGHNSVQIFFVLSGFLMSSMYPVLPSALRFIQKRYSRIFPPFVVVVLYLWITTLEKKVTVWYLEALILFLLAIAMYFILKIGRIIPHWNTICKILIIIFFLIQIGMIAVYAILVPKYQFFQTFHIHNFIIMLGNLTLTFPFLNGVDRLSPVFWSLSPEVLFYILYPFLVIPLVAVGRKWGYIVTIFLIIGMTKILLDLDYEFFLLGHIYILSIATCNGFVAGVTVGTLYRNNKMAWEFIARILKNPIVTICLLFLFFFMQWGDGVINTGQSLQFTNYYFLISSWIIAFTILAAVIPDTPANKLFSNKILVFLGVISYSLYLIHNQTIVWMTASLGFLQHYISVVSFVSIISYVVIIVITILVSYILFQLIERLYFVKDKTVPLKEKQPIVSVPEISILTAVCFSVIATIMLIMIYSGQYWPTLLISHTAMNSQRSSQEISLLRQDISIPFHANYANLEMMTLDMQYKNNASFTKQQKRTPANLIFKLYDQQHHLIYQSTRPGYDVEGQRHFPLGFLPIADSANKNYIMDLHLLGGNTTDYILVNTEPTSFVGVYAKPKANIFVAFITIAINRFIFTLENIHGLFALFFVWCVSILMFVQSLLVRRTRGELVQLKASNKTPIKQ